MIAAVAGFACGILFVICAWAWLDDQPRRKPSMPDPVQALPPPGASIGSTLVLPPGLADALNRMQGAHTTAAIKMLAADQARNASIDALNAKIEARRQLHAAIDQHFPD